MIANPGELTDCMSDEQAAMFLHWLERVIEHGYGAITIEVSNHHVSFLRPEMRVKLPDPGRGDMPGGVSMPGVPRR